MSLVRHCVELRHKFDNSLGSTDAEFLEPKTKFAKLEPDLSISINVTVKLV